MASRKKHEKTQAKLAKKQAKAELKARKRGAAPRDEGVGDGDRDGGSPAVRYAEGVRGILYVLMGTSLIIALLLGQRGAIVSLDDVIESLFAARVGKVVLAAIAVALLIYGMKHLRLVR